MDIEVMKISHYENVLKLWQSTEGMGLRNLDDSKEGIQKFLDRNPYTSFVAMENNKVIGTILCGHDGRRGFIYHTAVDENYRGRSIGRKLVNRAIEALKKEKINKSALVVFTTNKIGNNFWKSIGWEKRDNLNYYNLSLNDDN